MKARAARRRRRCPKPEEKRHALHLPHQARASTTPTIPRSRARSASWSRSDIEYAIKRFRDPKNRSPYEWLFENKLVGLDELAESAKKAGKFDYDAKIPGIEVRGQVHHQLQAEGARLQLPLRARDAQRGARSRAR